MFANMQWYDLKCRRLKQLPIQCFEILHPKFHYCAIILNTILHIQAHNIKSKSSFRFIRNDYESCYSFMTTQIFIQYHIELFHISSDL